MSAYRPPIEEMLFVQRQVAGLAQVLALEAFAEADEALVRQVLEEAGRFACQELEPLAAVADRQPARLENGRVVTPPGFAEAYRRFVEGGWNGLAFPPEWGGQGLPWLVNGAVAEIWNAANMTFELCPLLTQAGIEALLAHGSDQQKRLYLPKLVEGRWTAAMCLTEPQAGTDLGALRTRAERRGDHYRLFGQKIFITFGEHDMAENIVHFVLARLPDAPAGTRGISLFLVPKFLPDEAGRPGARNDFRCIKLEEKLGIHGSPTCVMVYGEQEGAVGFLVGREHEGMRCMFTMMNNARLAVGIEGLGLAEAAYQRALAYARERIQGTRQGRRVAIVEHPDVRRMLLSMRARIAAMRALCYLANAANDLAHHHPDGEVRRRAAGRVALLTPMVKAWCTDQAVDICSTALQVHGGAGFIEETGIARFYRDVRITPIYEGTNGIQARDLVGRKLTLENGRLPWELLEELRAELTAHNDGPTAPLAPALADALARVEAATRTLQQADVDAREAVATAYLHAFSTTVGAFLLARGARQAASDPAGAAWPQLARWFVTRELPPALAGLVDPATALTLLDPAPLALA